MADPNGFLKHDRTDAPKRPKPDRLRDWHEVYLHQDKAERDKQVRGQASRCMD